MKIAILSDIHDNIWKLATLLEGLKADVLIFCGDFCAPFTLAQIAEGFSGPVHVVFGNNDGDQFLLVRVASKFPHVTLHGDFAELELDSRHVAVTHYPPIGQALARGSV
jgi:predicted phosphodiesterase